MLKTIIPYSLLPARLAQLIGYGLQERRLRLAGRRAAKLLRSYLDCHQDRPVFLDVGSIGGIQQPWQHLASQDLVRAYGCDPQEADDIVNLGETTWLGCALGSRDSDQVPFYKTKRRCTSSFLVPRTDFLSRHISRNHGMFWTPMRPSDGFAVEQEFTMRLRRYESLVLEKGVPVPQFVKVDTQGYELEVLKGFGDRLDEVIAAELEVSFHPLYEEQPDFDTVRSFMEERGFQLRALFPFSALDGSVLLEMDAYFSRRPEDLDERGQQLLRIWDAAQTEIPTSECRIR